MRTRATPSRLLLAGLCAGTLLLSGCVANNAQTVEQQRMMDQLAADMQRLKRQLSDIQTPAPVDRQAVDQSAERLAELGERMVQYDTKLNELTGRIETIEYTLRQAEAAREAAAPATPTAPAAEVTALEEKLATLTSRVNKLEEQAVAPAVAAPATATTGETTAATATAATATSTVPAAAMSQKELYDEAYSLYRQGKHDQARAQFKEFAERFPDSNLTDNAYFWSGESYYDQGRYEEAILEYDKVVQKFSSGDKVAIAILKQAFAFSAIGDDMDAKILLQKVVNEYPGSEQAEIAKKKLLVIGQSR